MQLISPSNLLRAPADMPPQDEACKAANERTILVPESRDQGRLA